MKPLRNGDLSEIPGAAELIDSAQDAAKILAQRCAEKDDEIDRLRTQLDHVRAVHDEVVADLRKEIARLNAELEPALAVIDGQIKTIHEQGREIARLQEQVQYEQERNEGNVLLMERENARLREAENEQRATIFGKEAEAQKWANEAERLREAIKRYHRAWLRFPNDAEEHNDAWDDLVKIAREGR